MEFIKNFPFITIVLSLFCAVVAYACKGSRARYVTYTLLSVGMVLSVSTLVYNLFNEPGYFVYRMGHYDAPIGNEISAGLLEPFFAFLFETVLLLSVLGGRSRLVKDVAERRQAIFYVMVNLCHGALAALCYTNDIFTAYVFIEICTIASCSLLMARNSGRSLAAASRYMIFSLIGSGLVLMGIILLYAITGQLLFVPLYESIQELWQSGQYRQPLTVAIGLMVSGLAIKSGLFPFHLWMPDTYGTATPAASGVLSGVISKGYIFLLFKLVFRVFGYEMFMDSGIQYILLVFGVCGMIMGSVAAIHAHNIFFMVAYSSAAQIGYIYMGLGMGTIAGVTAALLQITAHALTKPMLFLASAGLSDTVEGRQDFAALRHTAHYNRPAGMAFAAGVLSMVGIPLFAGFVPKLLFATAAFANGVPTYVVLVALAVSTILNVVYFLRTLINIYAPAKLDIPHTQMPFKNARMFGLVMLGMALINVAMGLRAAPLVKLFERGIELFLTVR